MIGHGLVMIKLGDKHMKVSYAKASPFIDVHNGLLKNQKKTKISQEHAILWIIS
jgi:hypothetical protein